MYKIEQLRGKSLLDTHPKLVRESWNFEKNIDIQPEEVTAGMDKKVWWKCAKGHDYQARIAARTMGRGCPYCSGRKAIKGENDLVTTNPELIEEWNYARNELKPTEVMSGSQKKIWWRCKEGHDYQATIRNRTKGQGCPYCSGRKAIKGENDLATTHPKLLEEWNYERNEIKPTEVKVKSNKKVYWKCSKGHEYQARIADRYNGNGCPYCINKKIKVGYNDLATTNPELLEEWNYERNEISPTEVSAGSGKKVWWKCKEGHSWKTIIKNRTKGHGCPYCSGREVIKGVNDLGTTHSKLVEEEWNYEKNEIRPEEVMAGSGKKVWWKCSEGHSWEVEVCKRTSGIGCPYCSNHKILEGYNDLAITHPEMLEEWDYEKNEIRPEEVTAGSNKKVWWKCSEGHSWEAKVCKRTSDTGCPYCRGKRKVKV